MATIQVVLDDSLLELADRFAKRQRINRSALIREALRAHLKKLRYAELENQERAAYEQRPDDLNEVSRSERVADWREIRARRDSSLPVRPAGQIPTCSTVDS
ncbi:MAG: ribbon-helix-helix protein, CopG family [Acidobacteria bacterium]|nr:MAG: ribbon-helix-helix protein, CopG family [Acidobacteriota bacterium]